MRIEELKHAWKLQHPRTTGLLQDYMWPPQSLDQHEECGLKESGPNAYIELLELARE